MRKGQWLGQGCAISAATRLGNISRINRRAAGLDSPAAGAAGGSDRQPSGSVNTLVLYDQYCELHSLHRFLYQLMSLLATDEAAMSMCWQESSAGMELLLRWMAERDDRVKDGLQQLHRQTPGASDGVER